MAEADWWASNWLRHLQLRWKTGWLLWPHILPSNAKWPTEIENTKGLSVRAALVSNCQCFHDYFKKKVYHVFTSQECQSIIIYPYKIIWNAFCCFLPFYVNENNVFHSSYFPAPISWIWLSATGFQRESWRRGGSALWSTEILSCPHWWGIGI